MRLLRENACAQQWARGPPTHLFTRSFVHSSTGMSSGAPVTCPALSGHQAAARSVAGSHRLGVDLLCRSQARRQWGRVGAGSLSCEDAMRARRRSGRGARAFTAPPSCPASPRPPPVPIPPEPSLCSRARSRRSTCGLSGVGAAGTPASFSVGRWPPSSTAPRLAPGLPAPLPGSDRFCLFLNKQLPLRGPAPHRSRSGPLCTLGAMRPKSDTRPHLGPSLARLTARFPISASPGPAWQALPSSGLSVL